MYLNIKDGAIFVADSHYNEKNEQFLIFLEKLNSKEIETSQLILMGDNFDFISGESKYFIKKNKKVIDLLNDLSSSIEMIYLEGNHDYNLQKLFPKIKVIKRENQPLLAKLGDKDLALSHGDNFTDWKYNLYCKVIRNTVLLKFLNFIDINYFISKKIEESLLKKNICHNIKNFDDLMLKRLKNYDNELVIEGHFHQGKSIKYNNQEYINIPSLVCSNKYTKLQNDKFIGENI